MTYIINVFEGVHGAFFSPTVHPMLNVIEQGGDY